MTASTFMNSSKIQIWHRKHSFCHHFKLQFLSENHQFLSCPEKKRKWAHFSPLKLKRECKNMCEKSQIRQDWQKTEVCCCIFFILAPKIRSRKDSFQFSGKSWNISHLHFHHGGCTVGKRLALSPHSEKVQIPAGISLCGVCMSSPWVVGFLRALRFPPTVSGVNRRF